MSYTAGQVIKSALQRILVQASEADLEADEYADAMMALNAMMAAWQADGLELGYTDVDSVSDIVTVPPGAIRGIIANLAIEVAPDYNGQVSPALASQAVDGMKVCQKLGITVIPSQYPSTLPKGEDYREDPFYPDLDVSQYYRSEFKDPDSVKPVTIEWDDLMTMLSDTISASEWDSDGVTVDSDSNTTLTATAVISGGSDGDLAILTNTITTTGGYTFDRSVAIHIRER